jgi:hypothetical protein
VSLARASSIILLCGLLAPVASGAEEAAGLTGRVSSVAAPLPRATVYAYELARRSLDKVTTDAQGDFLFDRLPAGVYKLVAFKSGYEPAVVLLNRAAQEAHQFVDLVLEVEPPAENRPSEEYWSIRRRIPPDVLRDMKVQKLADWIAPGTVVLPGVEGWRGDAQAMTGFGALAANGPSQLTGGGVGMEAAIGGVQLGVRGQFWHLDSTPALEGLSTGGGQAATLALRMESRGQGEIDVTTVSQHIGHGPESANQVVDFERYRVSWSQPLGDRSRSRFVAQYTSQSNFYRQGGTGPLEVPLASRSLNLEGEYLIEVSDRVALQTGLRFREREGTFDAPGVLEGVDRALEVFGVGGWRAIPGVLLEYGLYTRLYDGTLALAPQGSLVLQLDADWQVIANASHRFQDGDAGRRPFNPLRFEQRAGTCLEEVDQHCYKVMLARQRQPDDLLVLGLLHREVADTVQVSFNDDLFSRLETLYLVRGDRLPELQIAMERRLTPRIVTRVESSIAQGGGGVLYTADNAPYENRVRFLVASVDTRFQQTSTGLFVAFHRLDQELTPLVGDIEEPRWAPGDLERLQLALTQDLNVLLRLAADWALHVGVEVSRGALPFAIVLTEEGDLRHRFSGGLSVRF